MGDLGMFDDSPSSTDDYMPEKLQHARPSTPEGTPLKKVKPNNDHIPEPTRAKRPQDDEDDYDPTASSSTTVPTHRQQNLEPVLPTIDDAASDLDSEDTMFIEEDH